MSELMSVSYYTYYLNAFLIFLPRLVAASVVLLAALLLARFLKHLVVKLFSQIDLSGVVKNTPLETYLGGAKFLKRVDNILGSVVYWFVALFGIYFSASILQFFSLTLLIEQVFAYLPNVFTALVVFLIGVVLAGVAESMVKGMARSLDPSSAILTGKMVSYLVMSLTMLIVLSELGIAREFIIIMFVGLVSAFALAFGLAVGLGGQHVVKEILATWYKKRAKKRK